jgi:hypothetical protein
MSELALRLENVLEHRVSLGSNERNFLFLASKVRAVV